MRDYGSGITVFDLVFPNLVMGENTVLCPFHKESTPSMQINTIQKIYHCFGCGVSGNVYTFVMKYENFSFPEAVRFLAEKAGVQLPEIEYSEEQKQRASRKARLLELNKEAAKFFYYQLRTPHGAVGYQYLQKRLKHYRLQKVDYHRGHHRQRH